MDNSTIGIKIADGTYYPIIEGESKKKKRLVLTTVNDDQGSVQIDLYKGVDEDINDALYVGSLVIEDIKPAMKGEPEIELIIGIDDEGNLNATAGDLATSEKQSLSVSLESLDDDVFTTPNFELEDDDMIEDDLSDESFEDLPIIDEELPEFDEELSLDVPAVDEELSFDMPDDFESESVFDDEPGVDDESAFDDLSGFDDELGFDEEQSFDDEEEPSFDEEEDSFDDEEASFEDEEPSIRAESEKKRSPLALIILIILILAILGIGAFFVIRGLGGEAVPPLEADKISVDKTEMIAETTPEPAVVAETEELAAPEPPAPEKVDEPAVVEETKPTSSVSETIPPAGRGGGVWYRLKWGDTLWDLSNSFYRTPWLYGLIAVENGIKNPDVIYAGTDLLIPEN